MPKKNSDSFNVDELLSSLFKDAPQKDSLKALFDRRIKELDIAPTNVLEILKISYRTLKGILNGTQQMVDFTNLIKLANFLQIPKEQVIQLYVSALERNFPIETSTSHHKVSFIKENFDLVALKKAGFIKSINDFEEIEKKLISFFGLRSILDYKKPAVEAAFSAGKIKPKSSLNRLTWIKTAGDVFYELNNPYEYNRQALVKYFPEIRWHSTNVEFGLTDVIRELFKIGITVIYQSPLPSLHLRGATFAVNDKPCIVITDYAGYYPTLWFALVHELFHVIFDWDEIKINSYHVSDEQSEQMSVIEKEAEADNFAREYLFSKEKTAKIRPYLNDIEYVTEFAKNNHVHPSFLYVFSAHDIKEGVAWAKAKKHNPKINGLLFPLENRWDNPKPITDYVNSIKYKFYL